MAGVAWPRYCLGSPTLLHCGCHRERLQSHSGSLGRTGAEVQLGEMLFTSLSFWKKTCVVSLTGRICNLCYKPLVVCLRAQERSFLHR